MVEGGACAYDSMGTSIALQKAAACNSILQTTKVFHLRLIHSPCCFPSELPNLRPGLGGPGGTPTWAKGPYSCVDMDIADPSVVYSSA
ncbi:hypothetical protein D5086_020352 [Populus alba]|uniref:Uncharacterized protein n=1 Tax=Populus alba TaxID=43335 RepID=A0ACC4BJS9_POPAL